MSWIQENKFTAALAGATVVGSIALISLASGKGDDFDVAEAKLKKALRNEAEIRSVKPYPNAENLQEQKSIVDDYAKHAEDLCNQFAVYRPSVEEVADFEPDKFSGIVSGYRNRLNEKFEASKTIVPDGCVYGFEAYASKFPRPEETGKLNYQIQATEWLLSSLADLNPEELLNVRRSSFDFENAPPQEAKSFRRGRRFKVEEKKPVYYAMPIELAFRADEKELNAFLSEIANAKKYPFVVRAMRVQNERLTPPTASDAKFAPADSNKGVDDFSFESFDLGGDAEEVVVEDAPAEELPKVGDDSDETRLLLPILGAEKVNVYLKLDLILLNQVGEVSLKEMKEKQQTASVAK